MIRWSRHGPMSRVDGKYEPVGWTARRGEKGWVKCERRRTQRQRRCRPSVAFTRRLLLWLGWGVRRWFGRPVRWSKLARSNCWLAPCGAVEWPNIPKAFSQLLNWLRWLCWWRIDGFVWRSELHRSARWHGLLFVRDTLSAEGE